MISKAPKMLMIAVAKALPRIAWGLVMVNLLDICISKRCESSRLA